MKGLLRQKEGERGKRNEASWALGVPEAPRRPGGRSYCLGPATEHASPSDNSIFPLWRQRRNSKFHASGCFPREVLEQQTRRFWVHAPPCPHGGVGHAYSRTAPPPGRHSGADWRLPWHPQRWPVLAGGPAPLFLSVSHNLLPLSPSLSFLILSLSPPPSHSVFLKSETNRRPTCIAGHSQHTSEF